MFKPAFSLTGLYNRKALLAHLLSFSLGLGLILSLGPALQMYSFAILNSGEPSVYSSIYGDNLVEVQKFQDWLFNLQNLKLSVVALVFVAIAYRLKTTRDIFLLSFGYFFIALTALDVWGYFFAAPNAERADLWQCATANLVGGALIGGIVLILLKFNEWILTFSQSARWATQLLSLAMPPGIGLLAVFVLFNVVTLFFKLTPSDLDLVLSKDVSTFYIKNAKPRDVRGSTEKSEDKPFGVLSHRANLNSNLTATIIDAPQTLTWSKDERPEKFDISLKFFSGCVSSDQASKISDAGNRFDLMDVRKIDLVTDAGASSIEFKKNDGLQSQFINNNGTQFWLTEEKGGKSLDVLAGDDSTLRIFSAHNKFNAFINIYLLNIGKNGNINKSVRNINFTADNRKFSIALAPAVKMSEGKTSLCRAATLTRGVEETKVSVNADSILSGIILELKPEAESTVYYGDGKAPLIISNVHGDIRLENVPARDMLDMSDSGRISGLIVRSGVKSMLVNDAKQQLAPLEALNIPEADLQASFDEVGQLHVTGQATAAYRGKNRLNRTRWERLDTAVKTALLAGVLALFGTAFTFVFAILRANPAPVWK